MHPCMHPTHNYTKLMGTSLQWMCPLFGGSTVTMLRHFRCSSGSLLLILLLSPLPLTPALPAGLHLVHLLGVVPAGGVDSAPVPCWGVEQRGSLEGAAVQAAVWGQGNQAGLTGSQITPDRESFNSFSLRIHFFSDNTFQVLSSTSSSIACIIIAHCMPSSRPFTYCIACIQPRPQTHQLPRNHSLAACAVAMALETVSGKYDLKKVVKDKLVFSVHHPLLPRRYVPAWQLDMKNRGNISQVKWLVSCS